ncbi:hypothetical protein [Natranaerovirga pectinivora]|nr:hypothetical protein [Natranaerovirga pectinivora]
MMEDNLFEKIFEGVASLCERQGIKKLKKIELIVNKDSNITESKLREDLNIKLPTYVNKKTKVILNTDDIGVRAIIKNVE